MQQFFSKPPPGTQINFAHPLAHGIVGCWLMNEQGWRIHDLSGYNNHGTLSGFNSPPERSNKGIEFDDTDNYITVLDNARLQNARTIEVWVKTKTTTNQFSTIIGKDGWTGALIFGWIIRTTNTGTNYAIEMGDGIAGTGVVTFPSLSEGWHQIIATYNNSSVYGYVDTILSGSVACGYAESNVGISIGRASVLNQPVSYFNGTIGLARIWNRTLSNDDIKSLYTNPYSMFIGV